MAPENRPNPIALRSRKQIIQSLLDLMEENAFHEITIKEIMFRAKLVRRTFYGHFSSKEEIIQAYLDDFFTEYTKRLEKVETLDTYSLALTLFEFCEQHKRYFRLLNRQEIPVPLDKLEDYLHEMDSRFNLQYSKRVTGDNYGYATAYFIGGFLSILNRWIEEGMTRSPEEMATIFARLVD